MRRQLLHILYLFLAMALGMLLCASCTSQGKGFALPEGDIAQGKIEFARLGCNVCHAIEGIERIGGDDDPLIELGGEVTRIKTYGELVTSVINPSHKIAKKHEDVGEGHDGQSVMKSYNDIMSVQQLVNIVTFLETEYEVAKPETLYYPYGGGL